MRAPADLRVRSAWFYRAARACARMGFARLAFGFETFGAAIAFLMLLSFLIVRSDWLGTAYQWGMFWTHYAAASARARSPVDKAMLVTVAVTALAVGSCRWSGARAAWRRIDRAARAQADRTDHTSDMPQGGERS